MKKRTLPVVPFVITAFAGTLSSFLVLVLFHYLFQTAFPVWREILDISFSKTIYQLRTPVITGFMNFITLFGADFTIIGAALVLLLFRSHNRTRESNIFISTVVIGVLLNTLFKTIFGRIRPDIDPLVYLTSYSYPSGHAMNAFVFYMLLAYYLIVFTSRSTLEIFIAVCSIVIVILVGISRVYLGVHYPTDVIGGYLAGFCIVLTAISVHSLLTKYST